jgi:fibronectin type 3 domain-containing protein
MNTRRIFCTALLAWTLCSPMSTALAGLSAPSDLTATAVSSDTIRLSWTEANKTESGFSVERSQGTEGAFVKIGTAPKNATAYEDRALAASTTYCYRVQATARKGAPSPYSDVACATTPDAPPPDTDPPTTPTGLTATASSCSQINLSWSASTDTGGSGLNGYKLYRNGSYLKSVLAPATSTSDTGLAASTTYSYQVSAVDYAGNESPKSTTVSATTPACGTADTTPPSQPTGLTATASSCSQINLSWNASTDTGGSGLNGYKLYRNGSYLKSVLAPSTSTSDTGLAASTIYSYQVSAIDNAGNESAKSSTASASTPSCEPPPPQTGGTAIWSTSFGGRTSSDAATAASAVTDTYGNVVVAGTFRGQVDFGGGLTASNDYCDMFLTKYSAGGTHLWTRTFGGTHSWDYQVVTAVAVDPNANILVTGYFQGEVDFGGGTLQSAGGYDVFLAKFSPDGLHLWSRSMGSANSEWSYGLAVDSAGSAVIAGYFTGTLDLGGGQLTSAAPGKIFIAKYSASGAHQWSRCLSGTGSSDYALASSVACGPSGEVLLTGYFKDTVDLGAGALRSNGSWDILIAKYSSTGTHLWSTSLGGAGDDRGRAVAAGPDGSVIAAGTFQGSVACGTQTLQSAGASDILLLKLSSSGSVSWAKAFGTSWDETPAAVAVDPQGNVLLAGNFVVSMDLGGPIVWGNQSWNVFVLKLSPSATSLWAKGFGELGDDHAYAIASDKNANVVVAGDFAKAIDFGDGQLLNQGYASAFLAKLAP